MNTGLVYLRVSTLAQGHKELPLDTQKEACLSLAQQKNILVNPEDIYVDTVSGRSMQGRNALNLLLERCKEDKNVKAVIIYDISRLSRNAMEYQAMKTLFQKKGVSLMSVNEPIVDDGSASSWILEFILSGFAEFRSRQDGEKIKNSMKNKVMSGGFCGFAHYGYMNVQEGVSSNKSKRWIEPDTTESPWVKRAHELFSSGQYTYHTLRDKLEEEGMKPRGSKKLHVSFIERVLNDELYIGVVEWGGARSENGLHQTLIDKEVFYRNQAIIKARLAGASRTRKHFFIIRSLVPTCGECGSRWTAGYSTGGSGKKFGLYHCYKRQKNERVQCSQISIPINELEKQFSELMKQVQLSSSVVERIRARVKSILAQDEEINEKIRKSLLLKIENAKSSQKRLLEKYIENKVNDYLYEETRKDLEKQEVLHKQELEKVETNISEIKRIIEMALLLINNCYKAYQKAPNNELKALLAQSLFKRLVIRDHKIIEAELNTPFSFLAQNQLSRINVFNEGLSSGDGRNRTAVQKII